MTGHTESVLVVFDPRQLTYRELLKLFWEHHDPAQGMAQGADVGTQYRSMIFTLTQKQAEEAQTSRQAFQQAMTAAQDQRSITTQISPAPQFYFAETYHQQYLAKNPGGYCGLAGLGICLT